jgi:hypothetical protein
VLCKEYGLNVEGMHGGPAFVKSSRQSVTGRFSLGYCRFCEDRAD